MTNPRIEPDAFYVNGNPIPYTYFRSLDTAQAALINANTGGTWAPTSAGLTIGGAGMWATGNWTLEGVPAIQPPAAGPQRITHGDSDWINYTGSGASRNLWTSMGPAIDTSFWTPGNSLNGQPSARFVSASHGAKSYGVAAPVWTTSKVVALGSFIVPTASNGYVYECTTAGTTSSSTQPTWPTTIGDVTATDGSVVWTCVATLVLKGGVRFTFPIRVHTLATVTAINFLWVVTSPHTSAGIVGLELPQMRVLRVDMFGNAVPLCTNPAASGYVSGGWVTMGNGSSTSAYYHSGNEQTASYPVDAGTVLDTSQYTYVAQVQDEYGPSAQTGNVFYAVEVSVDHIQDLRPQ